MTLYVPKPGERVRVIETLTADSRTEPVGFEFTSLGYTSPSHDNPGWLVAFDATNRAGFYCRVEPVSPVAASCTDAPARCDTCGGKYHRLNGWRSLRDMRKHFCSEACANAPDPGHAAPKPEPVVERRFCGCGQELFSKDQRAGGMCGDCGNHVVGRRPKWESLDARIAAAREPQAEPVEHAFERPGFSWP